MQALFEFQHVSKIYNTVQTKQNKKPHRAVNEVSFFIPKGQTLALVGASGSGKSTLAKLLMQIEPLSTGKLYYHQQNQVMEINKFNLKRYATKLQMVFQDPYLSLNPHQPIWKNLTAPLIPHKKLSKKESLSLAQHLLVQVGLSQDYLYRYPHTLSGGQCQRVNIARALTLNPEAVILDEPLSALDLSTQSQIIDLLQSLKIEHQLTYVFISHDLDLVQRFSDWMVVMYRGKLQDFGPTSTVFANPQSAYTKALIEAR